MSAQRILLAVTGLSPQVITETLYALAMRQPCWMPTEVHLLSTVEGAKRARLALLSEKPAWFRRLLNDYSLPEIKFDETHIHVLRNAQHELLEDIRTPEDNEQAADQITELVRRFTAQKNTELHVSIAGGRKTMGYYLGYALSLFGRPQDRLSHVLVSEPFESSWNFFYPTPYNQVIETHDKALADTRDAQVMLAEIPFVSLRHGLPEDLINGQVSFGEAVRVAKKRIGPPKLLLDLSAQCIQCGDTLIELPPAQLALLSVFARQVKNNRPSLPAPPKEVKDAQWAERFLCEYRMIRHGDIAITEKVLAQGMDGEYFSACKSKLHRQLKKYLGAGAYEYLIDNGGVRPGAFTLRLPPEAIHYTSIRKPAKDQSMK